MSTPLGDAEPNKFREQYLTMAGSILYAYALHLLRVRDGIPLGDGAKRLSPIDFHRPAAPSPGKTHAKSDSFFVGTLIDPATGKVSSGRPAWEAAGHDLYQAIK